VSPLVIANGAAGRQARVDAAAAALRRVRAGVSDADERVRDFDTCGIWDHSDFLRSVGITGGIFSRFRDGDVVWPAYARTRLGHRPSGARRIRSFIPCQIAWVCRSPDRSSRGAPDAKRGLPPVTFSEIPKVWVFPACTATTGTRFRRVRRDRDSDQPARRLIRRSDTTSEVSPVDAIVASSP